MEECIRCGKKIAEKNLKDGLCSTCFPKKKTPIDWDDVSVRNPTRKQILARADLKDEE